MSEVQQRAREMAAGLAREEDAAARQELMELYEVERLLKEKIDALASNRYLCMAVPAADGCMGASW